MQTSAEGGVTVIFAQPASVVAHVELVTALGHGRDPQVKLSKQSAQSEAGVTGVLCVLIVWT